jgi:mono/diheme cytochrome c family protein
MLLISAAACNEKKEPADLRSGTISDSTPVQTAKDMSPVERGKYLVTIASCNDCHTPWKMGAGGQPEPDMSRMLSGHPEGMKVSPAPKLPANSPWMLVGAASNTAFAGPWGISYTMNLTPDSATGIGTWTEDLFIKTIRSGKHYGTSRPIMPPMPWPFVSQMTDDDLKAVYAFLRSIPPIVNHVPPYEPPLTAAAGGGADTAKH